MQVRHHLYICTIAAQGATTSALKGCLLHSAAMLSCISDLHTHELVSMQVMRWSDGSYLEDQVNVPETGGMTQCNAVHVWPASLLRKFACHAVCQHECVPLLNRATCSQDHWWLSGISRDVLLVAKPATYISDFKVLTPLTFADDGSLELTGARCLPLVRSVVCQFAWPASERMSEKISAAIGSWQHVIPTALTYSMMQTGDQHPWRGRVSSLMAGRASTGRAAQHRWRAAARATASGNLSAANPHVKHGRIRGLVTTIMWLLQAHCSAVGRSWLLEPLQVDMKPGVWIAADTTAKASRALAGHGGTARVSHASGGTEHAASSASSYDLCAADVVQGMQHQCGRGSTLSI